MKKIIFILNDLERGGIPRVTLNLLAALDTTRVKADVFCANPRGIFLEELCQCQNVRVLPSSLTLRALTCNWRKERGLFRPYSILLKLIRHAFWKITKHDLLNSLAQRLAKNFSSMHYDWAIATSEGLPADIARNITASRAIWIHNDYAHDCSSKMPGLEEKLSDFERIVCVAEHARQSLCDCFPELSSKTCTIYNLVNAEEIIVKSRVLNRRQCYPDWNGFIIVSIGRFFDTQKKFCLIPEICAELNKRGLKFRWYLIGNGSQAETTMLKFAIASASSGDNLILLGEKANPYPFLSFADLFVITSAYETYPTVINEAKALGIPVLSTNFKGVSEVLESGDGIITPIYNFVEAIEKIIKGAEVGDYTIVHKSKDFATSNQKVLNDFYRLINA